MIRTAILAAALLALAACSTTPKTPPVSTTPDCHGDRTHASTC